MRLGDDRLVGDKCSMLLYGTGFLPQVASLTAVLLAMVVYSCFVTLQCMRVTLVKNLLVAILFQEHITLVLQVSGVVVLTG